MRLLVPLAFLAACAGAPAKQTTLPREKHQLAKTASLDLACPIEALEFKEISLHHWLASGCGKSARFRRFCRDDIGPGPDYEERVACDWEQFGKVQQASGDPALEQPRVDGTTQAPPNTQL